MRTVRFGAAVTIAVLTSSLLAACGGQDDSTGPSNRLTIHVIGGGSTIPENDIIKQRLDKKLGIDIRVTSAASGDDYYTQLAASLAGGTAADVFQVDRSRLQQFVRQGLVLDLTGHLDDDLKQYATFVEKDAMKVATFDDKVYGVVKRPQYMYQSFWIRKDWLDKLGLPMPSTTDDFRAVAKAFTERDPDGNGKRDTYGLTGGRDLQPWGPLWAAFGSAGLDAFYVEDGKVVNGYYDPDSRKALEYIRQLIADKVVDPDVLSGDALQAHQRALQGKAGIILQDWPHMTKPQFVDQYRKAQPNAQWVQLGPPSGPAGAGAMPHDANGTTMYAIPSSLKNDKEKLKHIFALMEYVSGTEGNRLVCYGVEGQHYTVTNDKVVATEKLTSEGEYFWLYQFSGRDEDEYLGAKFASQKPYIDFAAKQPTRPTLGSLVVQPEGFNSADAARYAEEQTALFLSGKRPLSQYDAFLKDLSEKFGYQKYLDSARQQLEELGATR